jgi:hypothetical protein
MPDRGVLEMSLDFYVLCKRPLSSLEEWQSAINELGFDLEITSECKVDSMAGFLPVTLHGDQTGFECSEFSIEDLTETYDEIDFGGPWPFAYAMYTGSMGGCVSALIAAAAIAKLTDGLAFDPQEGLTMKPDEAVDYARSTEREFLDLKAPTTH